MSDVTIKLDPRIMRSLNYYVPGELQGTGNASARVRYAVLDWLHERGSLTEMSRIDRSRRSRRRRR